MNVFINNKDAFNSKCAFDKFKTFVKSNKEYDLEELRKKYIKPEFNIALVSSTDTELHFLVSNQLEVNKKMNDESKKKELSEMLKAKLKVRTQMRTNSDVHKAKTNKNVPPKILEEYIKLKRISTTPVPEPSEILEKPEEYKPMLKVVLGNQMMKTLNGSHPYVRYFRLLAKEVGLSDQEIKEFNQPYVKPKDINDLLKKSDMDLQEVKEVKGDEIKELNEDADTETEEEK